ncbi:hypothetical protein BH09BAC1_BH09BAC1_26460 [soil metagenome]
MYYIVLQSKIKMQNCLVGGIAYSLAQLMFDRELFM